MSVPSFDAIGTLPDGRPDVIEATATLLVVVAFAIVGEPPVFGIVAGLGIATVRYVLGIPYAIAVGYVSLLASFPDGIDPLSAGIVTAAFSVLVLVSILRKATPTASLDGRTVLEYGVVTLGSALGFGAITWLVFRSRSIVLATAVLLGAIGLTIYGLHRYELVRLGKVPVDERDSPGLTTETTDQDTQR